MKSNINTRFSLAGSCLVSLLGVVVLLGWFTQNTALIQVMPQFVPMQFNTALCFLLAGLGLLFGILKNQVLSVALGSVVGLIALATLAEYILGVNLRIDELFMRHDITVETSHPGRMAPNTAFCFFLVFCYLLVFNAGKYIRSNAAIAGCFSLAMFVLSLFALSGYLVDVPQTYGWGGLTKMAVHTAAGFLLWSIVGSALVCQTFNSSKQRRDVYGPFVVFCITALIFVGIWSAMIKKEVRDVGLGVSITENHLVAELEVLINTQFDAVKRSGRRWEQAPNMSEAQWQDDAKAYVDDFGALQSMIRTTAYYDGSHITRLVKNSDGSDEFSFVIPVFANNKYLGSVVATYNVNDLLAPIFLNEKDYYNIMVEYQGEAVYKTAENISHSLELYEQVAGFHTYGAEWKVYMWPTITTVGLYESWVAGAMLVIGLIIAMCLATVFGLLGSLRALEERNRLILNSAGEGIYGLDLDGLATFVNPAAEEMLGYEAGELLGKSQHAMIHHIKADGSPHPREEHPIYASFRDGKTRHVEGEILWRKDGSSFPAECISHPARDKSGNIVGTVVTFKDVTKRKRLERNLERRSAELEMANKELESFSYSVSHDLRAPLRHIMSFVELLESNTSFKVDKTGQKHFRYVKEAAVKMGNLIDGLLNFSRAGRTDLKKSSVDLAKLAEESRERLSIDEISQKVKWSIDRLPTVDGDATLLSSVFDNLFSNAIKFTKDKSQAEIAVTASEQDGEYVIAVRDNGAGFENKYSEKIFDVFQRLHADAEFSGTGIGLANVHRIISRHGGKVWAEGEVNKGASIYFSLPKMRENNEG